jgi:MSHA biogenesis protein MshJ
MKALWLTWSAKVDALTLRERVILFVAAAAVIVLICNTFVLDPLFARRARLNDQIKQQNNNLIGLNDEITAKITAYAADPDAAVRKRQAEVAAEVAMLEDGMRTMQQGLVAPERIVPMLDMILKSNGRLRVMSLKTLPVSGLTDAAPGESKPADARPADPAAMAATTVAAAAASANAPGGAKEGTAAVALPAQLLYRHGVEITVEGAYLDMVNYMSALEAMPTQLFWGKAALDVPQYPRARLTLTLYTLSLDQKWMKL